MGVVDFDLQRERRMDLLREAQSRGAARRPRARSRSKQARGMWKFASAWVIGR